MIASNKIRECDSMSSSGKKGGNTAIIKKSNMSLIVSLIRQMGNVSRTELSKITGLSKGGLTPIIQELLASKLIRETGVMNSDAGRKPIMLEICPNAGNVIAVDFSRNSLQVALVDLSNQLRSFYEYKYIGGETQEEILKKLKSMIRFFIEENKEQKIVAIGVSAPGPLDYQAGIILNPPSFYGWKDIQIKDILEEEFKLTTFLDKDANVYATAEKVMGLGRNYHNFIHITLSEGIGAGIVLNDTLYRGVRGFGTEIGHTTLEQNGIQCECGNRGCLEQYASIKVIIKRVETQIEEAVHQADLTLKAAYKHKGKLEWEDILYGLESESPICMEALRQISVYLGCGLLNVINVVAPQAVIIGGRSALAGKYLLEPLKKVIKESSFYKDYYLPDIFISDLKDGYLIGAANTAFGHLIQESIELLL